MTPRSWTVSPPLLFGYSPCNRLCRTETVLLFSRKMVEVFYALVVLQILAGLYGLWEGYQWLGLARRRLASHPGFYAPRVALICPVKGVEPRLEQNLAALADFDYPNYEILFTLANSADPAHDVLRRVVSASKHPARIIIAGRPEGCGEKVNNLRAAVEQVPEECEVLVFADSDGRPGRTWLAHLVAPLADSQLGAATTYRWCIPGTGGMASALAACWNASVASQLGDHRRNFCWGGGTAIRRQVFDQVHALEFWRGSVSDDLSLTRALGHAGRHILFVPECLVPTTVAMDFDGLVEFTNRQFILTSVYAPRRWMLAGIAHLLYCLALVLGLGLFLGTLISGTPGLHLFLLTLAVPLLAAAKGYMRLAAATELLPALRQKLLSFGWVWTLLAALVPFLFTWNAIVAGFTRRIIWRGIRYELISPTQTRILSR